VEILYFDGCPNHEGATALVERVAAELGVEPDIRLVDVRDAEAAERNRFLGSPTVRVNGHDVEPSAEERTTFAHSCRVYRTENGFSGQPDERWVRAALAGADGSHTRDEGNQNGEQLLPTGVERVLTAAAIPSSKFGPERQARLTESERELYLWLLRQFATSGRPSSADIHAAASGLGLDAEGAFAALAREDLVHVGSDGEVRCAYPFSGTPTAHRVRFEDGHEAFAMCALDALGIAPMFGQPVEITSTDPASGEELRVRLAPNGESAAVPDSTVVVTGVVSRECESFLGCCPVLNFFGSQESAEQWLAEHDDVRGQVVSMPDAIAAGRVVFGNVLGPG
jgi:hypothetical protein